MSHYRGIYSKSFADSSPSGWHRHERGIFAGCTVSIILFLAGMNVILEYYTQTDAFQFLSNGVPLPLLQAFMDDFNLMSSSVQRAHTLLQHCTTALKWAGLEFRADKSRSIVIIKGRSMNTTPFSVSPSSDPSIYSSFIPSIHTQPVKFLGRIIDGSLTDRKSIEELEDKLLSGLKIIDGSCFSGTQKLWIMQHLLIPRIQWPLLIYEMPMSLAARLEQKISTFIRKWLHLHNSMSSLCFYSADSPCPLPIKSLTSVLKASKISGHLLLKHSHDPLVSSCPPKLKTGSWEVEKAVNVTEQDIKLQQMTGYHYQGCHGIEYINTPKAPEEKSSKRCRDFISRSFKEIDETYNISKAVQLLLQGQWTRQLSYIQQDFSWKCLLASPINLISFCLSSIFNTLSSPSNLKC